MILNHQSRLWLDLAALRAYALQLSRVLHLGRRDFNVCFVDDEAIRQLNAAYRGKPYPTDVLSFPWEGRGGLCPAAGSLRLPLPDGKNGRQEFENFLGDVVISTETARRNALLEGHSAQNEIRRLILHGVLHLLGYDHAADNGEMTELEHSLRGRLSLRATTRRRRIKRQAAQRHG